MQEPDNVADDRVKKPFRAVFSELPFFEDVYLGMQALNLDIVDGFLEDQETALLRRYFDLERTPPETLFVSALSQLWIFGMYEVLRTWRQRVEEVLRFVRAYNSLPPSQRQKFLAEKRKKIRAQSQHAFESPWPYYSKALKSKKFLERLHSALDGTELAFRRIEAFRISLAKHEIPKSKGAFAMAPGYGRIDMTDGSIYWQIILEGDEVDLASRRAIADDCRRIGDVSKFILPRDIQRLLTNFPHYSYGKKRVTVQLKNGRRFDGVIVAWDKQIVFVENTDTMPFDARDVVGVQASPKKIRKTRAKAATP